MTADQWEAVTVMVLWCVKAGLILGAVSGAIAFLTRSWWA